MYDITVLIIDDQQTMHSILRSLLHQADIRDILDAENVRDGLEIIENPTAPTPDIIICDLHMDVIDGMEFVHHLRRAKNMTPVLVLTGERDGLLRDVVAQAGATKILTKPISAPDLRAEILSAIGFQDDA